jgi:hypothetical protein
VVGVPVPVIDPEQDQRQRYAPVSNGEDEIQNDFEVPFVGEPGGWIYEPINVAHEYLLSWR